MSINEAAVNDDENVINSVGGEAPNDGEDDDNDEDFVGGDTDSNDSDADEDELTNSIITKWRNQGMFIRFLNGNTHDCSIYNLCFVSLDDAMDHIDDWKVDWDMDLTRREIALVKDPVWRAGLSQPNKYAQPARDAYNEWCVTYGKVPTDDKFAVFFKHYVGMKRSDAHEKAKAQAAGVEYVSPPFTMNAFSCLTFDEMDALCDRFGDNKWAPLLDLEADIAYDKWCAKLEKEPSDGGRSAFKMNYISALVAGMMESPEMDEHADKTEVEMAEMKER